MIVLGTAGTASADTDCEPEDAWTETTDWVTESPGEGWYLVDERTIPGTPEVVEYEWRKQVVDEETTTYLRYSWNPKGSRDESDGPPTNSTPVTEPQDWKSNTSHYNGDDPLNQVFQDGNGAGGDNASWFYWTATVETTYTWEYQWSVESPGEEWEKTGASRVATEGTPDVTEYKFAFDHPAVTCDDPQPEYFLETSHTVSCGTATITLRNVSPWIYPVSYRVDGGDWQYGPVVDNRGDAPDDQTASKTFTFAEDSGTHTIEYVIKAGSEADLYVGLPVGEITTITVDSDCKPNQPSWTPDSMLESRTVDGDVDCEAGNVQVIEQTRTRTETAEGVWGAWSEWATVTTSTREATAEECPVVPAVEDEADEPVVLPAEAEETAKPGKDEVLPAEAERPRPKPVVAAQPEALPTAVDAGLGPVSSPVSSPTSSPLGQGLLAGGLLMLLLAGALQAGRRERGAHEA